MPIIVDTNDVDIREIKSAVINKEVITYYQPIMDNKNDRIAKYEALVRMKDRNNNILMPYQFLNISKKIGLYEEITKYVVLDVISKAELHTNKEFSINISIDDIVNQKTSNYILESLMNNPNVSSRIILEIVESDKITSYELVNNFIKNIKQLGAKIAIDDFGAGYSNFNQILNVSADYIKIDGSLIQNILNDEKAYLMVKMLARYSESIGMKTIAEFVESQDILNIIKGFNIDYSQGYYTGEPKSSIER